MVRTFELAQGSFHFRVEVLRHGRRSFSARIWRLDLYRIQPTFSKRHRADEQLWVMDDFFARDFSAASVAAVLRKVTATVHSSFTSST